MAEEVDMRYGQYDVPKRPVKLNVGQPAPSMLPLEVLHKGYGGFRHSLAEFLREEYKEKVDPSELFVTQGVTGALSFYCSLFTQTGSTVFVEEPTYFLAINIFKQDFRLNVVSVPITPTGIDLDALEAALIADKSNSPRFLYTIPCYHNPTSYTLPHEKRVALAALAEKYQFNIVADEVYQMLYFEEPKPPLPLCYYSPRALSCGSFSKILAPALRLGFIQARGKELMDVMLKSGQMDSSGGNSPLSQALVHGIILSKSLHSNIRHNQEILARNCKQLSRLVREKLGNYVDFIEPNGGYFLWLHLKAPVTAQQLMAELPEVQLSPGSRFSAAGACQDYIRVSFSYYDTDDFEFAVEHLRRRFAFLTPVLG